MASPNEAPDWEAKLPQLVQLDKVLRSENDDVKVTKFMLVVLADFNVLNQLLLATIHQQRNAADTRSPQDREQDSRKFTESGLPHNPFWSEAKYRGFLD